MVGFGRIAVTGLGAISPLGLDAEETWISAQAGIGGIVPTLLDAGPIGPPPFTVPLAPVKGDGVAATEAALGRRIGGSLDPFAVYALKAAHEALTQARLLAHPALKGRTAVILGSGIGGLVTLEKAYVRFFDHGQRVHPLTVPRTMVSAPVSAVAMEFGVTGPVFAVASACASSGHAIAQGAAMIAAGLADVAIVGGAEAMATPGGVRAWEGLQATSQTACRPFSAGRDGMVIGDGAGVLILESETHAEARGAAVLAWLVGAGQSSDAFHWTQPSLEGAVSAMRQACEAGALFDEPEVLISAHGTGTPLNDKNEAEAIRALFGAAADRHPVIATKSAHGHLIGASMAVQIVIALKALAAASAPPILNWLGPDPECDLDLVLGEARPIAARALLANAFAFGGLNVSLVFRI